MSLKDDEELLRMPREKVNPKTLLNSVPLTEEDREKERLEKELERLRTCSSLGVPGARGAKDRQTLENLDRPRLAFDPALQAIVENEIEKRLASVPSEKPTILTEAQGLITGDRNKAYGSPSRNHGATAELWEAYLRCRMPRDGDAPTNAYRYGEGFRMEAYDVCVFNMLQKIARLGNQLRVEGRPHRDSLVDIAGYAGNMEMIEKELAEEQRALAKEVDPRGA